MGDENEPTAVPTLEVELEAMRGIDKILGCLPPEIAMRILDWERERILGRCRAGMLPPRGSPPRGWPPEGGGIPMEDGGMGAIFPMPGGLRRI